MNERIKELAMSIPRIKDMYDVGPVQRASIEEFAELILEECCKVIDGHYEPVYDGSILKEYFGVE